MTSLRIGTFNSQLDSLVFEIGKDILNFLLDPEGVASEHDTNILNKSQQIAERILYGGYDYDVIVLNEVFSEDARAILMSKLSAVFPYAIEKLPKIVAPLPSGIFDAVSTFFGDALGVILDILGIHLPDIGEDSGLMLFSKYPIVESNFRKFTFPSLNNMAFAIPDSLAAKGVGYARLLNPTTGEHFNLVFTHLQENLPKWRGVRTNQLSQIEEFIKSLMTESMIRAEDIFMVGDLNIIGNWNEVGPRPKDIDDVKRELSAEWKHHFSNPSSFFTNALRDTWFYETSTKDEGHTSPGGSRLDYILHNPPGFRRLLKIQHLTKAYNLFSTSGGSLSDHFGLNADINHDAPYCNPRSSYKITPADGEYISGEITYGGSIVWYRVDDPGTYSIAVLSSKVMDFTLYQSIDLSLPLGQYKDETTEHFDERQNKFLAKKYVIVDPPYYIRVYHPNPAETGSYNLFIHKHAGISKDDAIVLYPYVLYPLPPNPEKPDIFPALFPTGRPINSDDTVWFQFNTLKADSGVPQDINCKVSKYPKGVFRMSLVRSDGITPISNTGPDPSEMTLSLSDVGPSKMYLLVTRDDPTFSTSTLAAGWGSNLTVFHGFQVGVPGALELKLICNDETNPEPMGSDEIVLRIWVDGTKKIDSFIGKFNDDDLQSLEDIIPKNGFRFLERINVQLYERDHVSPDDPSESKPIEPLRKHFSSPSNELKFSFEGGEYTIQYNLSSQIPTS